MLEQLARARNVRSRIGGVQGAENIRHLEQRTKRPSVNRKWGWYILLWMLAATLCYWAIGHAVQYVDPTAGWLDTGMLSIPLFAAWSSLVGYSVAGLLPVILKKNGKKGGIKKWNSTQQTMAALFAYAGYIALLCALW